MRNKKQIGKLLIGSVIIFVAAFAAVMHIKADSTENVTGWTWGGSDDGAGSSSGVGWFSMNNSNPAAGGAVSYGVNIPASDGSVIGYAWSENVGYLDFDPQDHCITTGVPSATQYLAASCTDNDGNTGGVTRSGNSLVGWARVVSIAQTSATGNSGGWQGWVKMNGANYGITIDPATGKISGYAWNGETSASDGLGVISFRGNVGQLDEYGAQIAPSCIVPAALGGGTKNEGETVTGSVANGACNCSPQVSTCTGGAWVPAISTCTPTAPTAGTCGSANNGSFPSPPSSTMCDNGGSPTPASLSGSGPWSWTCSGICGGAASGTCNATQGGSGSNWKEVAP